MIKNRIAPKQEKQQGRPFDFTAPPYDERTSCYMSAGTDFGVGFNQPVGHEGNPKSEGVPMGRQKTMSIYPHAKQI